MKTALTIAGSDCSGGAGIQADLKTFAAHGVYGMSAVTAVVAENTCHVLSVQEIPPRSIRDQITAVFEDIGADAVKIGMLPGAAAMEAVAERLGRYAPGHTVVDPVMAATGGGDLMDPAALAVFVREIVPLAEVLTPNIPEAETLAGLRIDAPEKREAACRALHGLGARWVLLKGGHLGRSEDADDLLFDGSRFYRFTAKRIATKNTHGTGCTLSSAIAANLALGKPVPEAVRLAKEYVTGAIAHGLPLGKGYGPTHHFYEVYRHGLPKQAL